MTETLIVCVLLTLSCVSAFAQGALPEAGSTPTASCQIAAERFKALAGDATDRTPLAVLKTPGSDITAEPARVGLEATPELIAWAAAQTPAVQLPEELRNEGAIIGSGWLEQLPGTAFYAIHEVGGTAHCYASTYFEVDGDGTAHIVAAPAGIPDGSCMVSRSFGMIGRTPVMFEDDFTLGPAMRSSLTIASWKDRSWEACRLTFEYEPVFLERTSNTWESNCTGDNCDRLRSAAYQIAAAVQTDPQRARQDLLADLSESQQLEYKQALDAARLESPVIRDHERDPTQLTKEFPFRVPYADGERLYIVGIGHFTIGWRYFADWSVTFREVRPDGAVDSGSFAIGMLKGRVSGVSIKAL
jgi:hypothetical protein